LSFILLHSVKKHALILLRSMAFGAYVGEVVTNTMGLHHTLWEASIMVIGGVLFLQLVA